MNDIEKLFEHAPEGADKLEQHKDDVAFGHSNGKTWCPVDKKWCAKTGATWKTIATRPEPQPEIIDVADMKEGMKVECVEAGRGWYEVGEVYTVGTDRRGCFGPLGYDSKVSLSLEKYKFTLVEQPRKTVEDVVEHYNVVWPGDSDFVCLWDTRNECFVFWLDTYEPVSGFYEICTKEQFEACVAAKREITMNDINESIKTGEDDCPPLTQSLLDEAEIEPKWTHIGMRNQKCVILAQIASKAWIKYDDGRECVKPIADLKPIKPTITKAEAWDMICQGLGEDEIRDTYTITD